MSSIARAFKLSSVGMLLLACVACAGMSVHSFTEKGADLRRYRTYKFGPADTGSTGDPRLDNNRFFNERVQANVEKMLAARGYQKATTQNADVLVHYHASVTQQIEINERDRFECVTGATGTGTRPLLNCRPYVYDAGTLLIDLVDGRTQKLLWRGWSEGNMEDVMANQEWMEQRVDESVKRIMEQLPSRL